MGLDEWSIEELKQEIKLREEIELKKPVQVDFPDLTKLREACSEHLELMLSADYSGDTTDIFECAIEALYEEDVWDYINKYNGVLG